MTALDSDLAPLLGDLRAGLEALYGERLAAVVLYGSHARGEATEDSDVDVLAVLRGEVRPAAEVFHTSALALEVGIAHGALVSIVAISEDAYEEERYPFLRDVHLEGRLV